ncbi:MAG: class I SAM-dependent methyltransferase [Planctomycetes bacterium]|nr:class I SAM-dependent methyltransferase [Planctomycetota bacterium]
MYTVILRALSVLLLGTLCVATQLYDRPAVKQLVVSKRAPTIRSWEYVDGFPERIAVFQTVFWEPRDTNSMRELIETTDLVRNKSVLEIGTGSGLVSLCSLRAGAASVIATDVNQNAIENARYNANALDLGDRFETRLVSVHSAGAFSTLIPTETFDIILSNPPWENAQPRSIDEYALYDRDFELLRSILLGVRTHLKPGGRLLLAYGCCDAILTLEQLAPQHGLRVQRLDDRRLDDLPEVFVPGMLVELLPRKGCF